MRIVFTADEGGFEGDEDCLICGVAGGDRWLTFQRDAEDSSDDWDIHLEYSGQINSGYGCVAACRISPESLSVDLDKPLGQLIGVTGFDVALRLDQEQVAALRSGLRSIFRGHLNQLTEI
jgi:hypothetical protein